MPGSGVAPALLGDMLFLNSCVSSPLASVCRSLPFGDSRMPAYTTVHYARTGRRLHPSGAGDDHGPQEARKRHGSLCFP